MIRDRLRSCKHTKHVLSQQPQLEANLTLDEAKIKVRHHEAVGEQQWELKVASGDSTSLEEIHSHRRFSGKKQSSVTDSKRRSGQILKENASAVEKNHIPMTNVLQRMQYDIAVTKRATTTHNAKTNACPK